MHCRVLPHIDPDDSYEDWLHVGMAIHHEFGGNDAGFDIFDAWSSQGPKYLGQRDLEKKWRSFDKSSSNPVTLATICQLAADNGADLQQITKETRPAKPTIRICALAASESATSAAGRPGP